MTERACKEVYRDAMKHDDLPASVIVFLFEWVPWMFRKMKRQQREIENLKNLWEHQAMK